MPFRAQAFVVKTASSPAPGLVLVSLRQTNDAFLQAAGDCAPDPLAPAPEPEPEPEPEPVLLEPVPSSPPHSPEKGLFVCMYAARGTEAGRAGRAGSAGRPGRLGNA